MAIIERHDVTGGLAIGGRGLWVSPDLAVFQRKIGELGFLIWKTGPHPPPPHPRTGLEITGWHVKIPTSRQAPDSDFPTPLSDPG